MMLELDHIPHIKKQIVELIITFHATILWLEQIFNLSNPNKTQLLMNMTYKIFMLL
jgi:hypothetical protein